jgi:hypothetical protein
LNKLKSLYELANTAGTKAIKLPLARRTAIGNKLLFTTKILGAEGLYILDTN